MRTIEIKYKALADAAALLVANAPARGDFWGVPLRARYATTNPADIVAHHERKVREGGWSYGARLTPKMRARLVCDTCGAAGCKMWREYQTFANRTKILCGPCAKVDQGKIGAIDVDGKIVDEDVGRCDQIGWLVPAVPVAGDDTFWGYTSVPADGCAWWRALPSYPPTVRARIGEAAS